MKPFLTSFATLVLSSVLTLSIASALTSPKTTTYNGETILVFDLSEVEIKADRIPAVKPANDTKKESSSTLNIGSLYPDNKLIEENNLTTDIKNIEVLPIEEIAGITVNDVNANPAITNEPKQIKAVYKKRPLIHFIANKACWVGVRIFETLNDGLFFRS